MVREDMEIWEEPVSQTSTNTLDFENDTYKISLQVFYPEFEAEVGWSMEKALYGGGCVTPQPDLQIRNKPSVAPIPTPTGPFHFGAVHFSFQCNPDELPDDLQETERDGFEIANAAEDAGEFLKFHIPIWWTSAMFCEKFWQTAVKEEHLKAFHPPFVLRQEYAKNGSSTYFPAEWWRGPPRDYEEGVRPSWDILIRRWEYRVQSMSYLRPWEAEERRKWLMTPWSLIQCRKAISDFGRAHAARDRVQCMRTADFGRGMLNEFNKTRITNQGANSVSWVFVSRKFFFFLFVIT